MKLISWNVNGFRACLGKGFAEFLKNIDAYPMKCEYYLPFSVREMMDREECTVQVYRSDSSWYGVTYHEDKENVKRSIAKLIDMGMYPKKDK